MVEQAMCGDEYSEQPPTLDFYIADKTVSENNQEAVMVCFVRPAFGGDHCAQWESILARLDEPRPGLFVINLTDRCEDIIPLSLTDCMPETLVVGAEDIHKSHQFGRKPYKPWHPRHRR